MDGKTALEILDRIIAMSDADAVEASIQGGTQFSTRFADNVITQNVSNDDVLLRVSCAYGGKHARATTNSLADDSLTAVVKRAESAARVSPPDPEYMPPLGPDESDRYLKVDGYYDSTAGVDPESTARAIRKAVDPAAQSGYRLSGAFACQEGLDAFANSAGLRACHRWTNAHVHSTVLGVDGSGWAQSTSNNVDDIDVPETSARALSIAQRAQSPADIAPGKYTVILSPAAVAELMCYMICDAKATDEGRTFLRGKLGTKVCGDNVTIRSDPGDPECPGFPFRDDGFASPKLPWIQKGVLTNLATTRFWAKKTGRQPTDFPSNIIMDGGNESIEEMVDSTERGILVTRFWYIRYVDPMESLITGMTRDGLFLITDGRIDKSVKNLRFNESVLGVLNRVESLGRQERMEWWFLVPALKVRDFNFTSTTKF